MLNMTYCGDAEIHIVSFKIISKNIVQLLGDFPVKECGFTLSRIGKKEVNDYTDYTTVYREVEGGVQFSNDGSVYVAPPEPELVPEPEPYIPTLEDLKRNKICEMEIAMEEVIAEGFNATLSDGTIEHFTLSSKDQLFLTALQTQVLAGVDPIPWHVSDRSVACKNYSNMDMGIITQTAMGVISFHETYIVDMTRYITSIESEEELEAVSYGMTIPEEYQSEPLKNMLAQKAV